MSVRVSCPFCHTAFDLPAVPASRHAPCPRCGEMAPIRDAVDVPDGSTSPPPAAPAAPPSPPPKWAGLSLGLTALVVVAFAVWWFTRPAPPPAPTGPTQPAVAPATRPPATLPALKYLPRDSQIVLAVQPQQVIQYAERTGRNPRAVFADLGLPQSLLDSLTDAGLPPDAIDHLTFAASAADLWVTAVVVTRAPVDAGRLRDKLDAKVNADNRDRSSVQLGGVRWDLEAADDRTLVFALLREANLDAAKAPSAGLADLRAGLRESVQRLSPSSFVWAATDDLDWSKVKGLELAAGLAKQPDLAKRLEGVRAVAAGVSFEPDLTLGVRVRTADSTRAAELAATMTERLKGAKGTATADGVWSEASVPFDPPQDALGLLKQALQK